MARVYDLGGIAAGYGTLQCGFMPTVRQQLSCWSGGNAGAAAGGGRGGGEWSSQWILQAPESSQASRYTWVVPPASSSDLET